MAESGKVETECGPRALHPRDSRGPSQRKQPAHAAARRHAGTLPTADWRVKRKCPVCGSARS